MDTASFVVVFHRVVEEVHHQFGKKGGVAVGIEGLCIYGEGNALCFGLGFDEIGGVVDEAV